MPVALRRPKACMMFSCGSKDVCATTRANKDVVAAFDVEIDFIGGGFVLCRFARRAARVAVAFFAMCGAFCYPLGLYLTSDTGGSQTPNQRINEFIGYAVARDVAVDLVLMIAVKRERIEDLRQRQVRQPRGDFFGRDAHPPHLDDGAHRRAGVLDDGFAA